MRLPCLKNARRIFAIVSTTSIPTSASKNHGSQCGPSVPGSRLEADHPEKGVLFACRFTAAIRLYQIGVPLGGIDALLLTHYHSDHTSGVPDVWLTGWLQSHYGTRTQPSRVLGPTGAKELMSNLERAYAADIKIRIADEKLPPEGVALEVEEFNSDGTVYRKNGVTVIAFEVDHGDVIKPAYGYRIEYGGRSVVISGDTRFNENVINHGLGADLLIHEVAIARPELMTEAYIQRIMAHHTTAREVGIVFARARPKLAVCTHLVFLASKQVPSATVSDLIAEIRQTYHGPLEVGEDLMRFEIEQTVSARRAPKLALA